MRSLVAVVVSLLCATAFPASAGSLPAPIAIEIPSGGYVLHAQLYRPNGPGPFPTVIALHGCGGLAGRSDPVQPRYRDWAADLVKDGKAVLLPDSYASRGLGPQCRVKDRRISGRRERVADIVIAQKWLTQQSWAMPDRISLVGWASGASALLWAVRPQLPEHVSPDFRSAVAFYPDCRASSGLGWSARVPTLILIGGLDDVYSPPACRQMIDGARGRSALTRIVVYPGAYHDFDRINLPFHQVAGADAAAPERGHVGSDPEARADARKLVSDWLAR
ncbi:MULTISPECIES: dienelactone hydrolase family protein [unclassified Bradyrhizobium]|uniref:dienelactone hydrolase family protein n=1 Tax=unclassified Bradyrhizobium TaxID=2631580 RepID=UPI0028E52307|nr:MULTISPECIES: dienelactone hydrolase family protein [unclassified Bradyrhizobium]